MLSHRFMCAWMMHGVANLPLTFPVDLARTAAQLLQAGPNLLWVVQEDTHSLRKLASTKEHYDWIIRDTDAFLSTLGITYKYLHADSPFELNAPRSPVIETYQRNQALNCRSCIILLCLPGWYTSLGCHHRPTQLNCPVHFYHCPRFISGRGGA